MNRFTRSVLRNRYRRNMPRVFTNGTTRQVPVYAGPTFYGNIPAILEDPLVKQVPMTRRERRRAAAKLRSKRHWTEFL